MSFTASFWTFAKEVNSTAVPQGAGTQFSCVANGGIDIINPVISLQRGLGGTNSPVAYNYCRIPTFGNRYYFVENWRWENGLWHAYCSVDVLATYKTGIGNLREYVVRSAEEYNGRISDALYPAKEEFTYSYTANSGTQEWVTNLNSGCYVVGVLGNAATRYYAMNAPAFGEFISYILSTDYVEDVIGELALDAYPEAKIIVDPLQYIASVIFMPVGFAGEYSSHTIKVGYVDVEGVNCAEVDGTDSGVHSHEDAVFTFSNIAPHPWASQRGEYLNYAPWTRRYLYIPPFGLVELDCTEMESSISALIKIDMITGACRLHVFGTNSTLMLELKTQIGIQIQLSQVISKGMGALTIVQKVANIVSQTMGGITGGGGYGAMNANIQGAPKERKSEFMGGGAQLGGAASFVSGTAGFIRDAIESKIPTHHSVGSMGGVMDIVGTPYVRTVFMYPVDESRNTRGRPLCSERLLSSLAKNNFSGYILVADPDITGIAATATEREMIKSFLAGGFYLA